MSPPSGASGVTPPPQIIPFRAWAPARVPAPTGGAHHLTTRLVVHHSFEPVATTEEDVPAALVAIADIHLARGFDTFGYHYAVDPWGRIWQGRGELPEASGAVPSGQHEGAHVAGSNPGAVGVVFIGDHDTAPPTAAALDAAVWLLAWLAEGSAIDPLGRVTAVSTGVGTAITTGSFEVPSIAGHRESNATACPGQHLAALLPDLRGQVAQRLALRASAVHDAT